MGEQSMVERVARVLCRRAGVDPDREGSFDIPGRHGLVVMSGPAWKFWKEDARAAIEAMREPTGPMIDAPEEARVISAAEGWRAMIDAALSDPTPSPEHRDETGVGA